MRFSGKQKKAVEKITGRYWYTFSKDSLEKYFNFTDKGIPIDNVMWSIKDDDERKLIKDEDLNYLLECHHWHTVTVEMWKEDFKKGLLFLDDFLDQDYPKAYIDHVLEIYKSICGGIPSKYEGLFK